jgi:hypothetical protein
MRTSFRCALQSVAIAVAVGACALPCLASEPREHARTIQCIGQVTVNRDGSVEVQGGMARGESEPKFEIRADRIVVRKDGVIEVLGKGSLFVSEVLK